MKSGIEWSLFILAFVFCSFTEVPDSLVLKKTKSGVYEERFFVKGKDPNIKHDQYVKTYTDIFDIQKVVELGNYDSNQKTGLWMDFYHLREENMLKSFGEFVHGEKSGDWYYYYDYNIYNDSYTSLLQGSYKHNQTTLTIPKSKKETCTVSIDTTNMRLMEYGRYEKDKKVGIWEYYSKEGLLLQKYDHTLGKLLENNDKTANSLIYLGGFDRFYNYTSYELNPKTVQKFDDVNTLDFKVKDSGFELVDCKGSTVFASEITKLLKSAPLDWIQMSTDENKILHYLYQLEKNPENAAVKYSGRFVEM